MDIDDNFDMGYHQEHKEYKYSDAMTDHQIGSILQGSPSFIDLIPPNRMTDRLVDLIVGLDRRFLVDIPKSKWTDYAILCTVLSSEINHLIDPSLITEKLIDQMLNHSIDSLRLLPFELHTERHCERAVLGELTNILHINPVHIEAVINKALLETTSHLGGFAHIQDSYQTDISELIRSLNVDAPLVAKLGGKAKGAASLMLIYKHRLSKLDKKEFTALCKELGAPETFKFVYGAHEAAAHFPGTNKRQWLQEDMQL